MRAVVIGLAALILATAVGCAKPKPFTVDLPDGRTVTCVGYESSQPTACDWNNAK